MLIRPATLTDLSACLALDANSQTDHVWQMEAREEQGGIAVRFYTVRLPRIMHVVYPRHREDLLSCWEQGTTLLVATTERPFELAQGRSGTGNPGQVLGYCQLDEHSWQRAGWLSHLIVDRPFRRRGVGSAMLEASTAWARKKEMERLMIAVQTKNYPAISFCEKHRFVFCGFNDHYFSNRDIALFFSLKVRR
jgi:ribosomal protein S18 acetylase RimI-like enzyme